MTATAREASPTVQSRRVTSRGAATRTSILDAAQELFIRSGFGAVSLREIASAAGISHPGLLRHFSSRGAILDALLDRLGRDTEQWMLTRPSTLSTFGDIARRNALVPGYVELFSTLAGEATSLEHPSHERFRIHYERLRTRASEILRQGIVGSGLPSGFDPILEATRLIAAWDGLQLLSLYFPDRIDVADSLDRHVCRLTGSGSSVAFSQVRIAEPMDGPLAGILPVHYGYAPGRESRARIVECATTLFAEGGFHSTGLQDIAHRAGINKSTLQYHFASKDELLQAVLVNRDASMVERLAGADKLTARTQLENVARSARRNAIAEPGLIQLHAVLSCEAAAFNHPANAYFTRRFTQAIAYFEKLLRRASADGDLRSGLDPAFEAMWLISLWDGLQFQWLYEPGAVDVAAQLEEHVAQLLTPVPGGGY